MDWLEAFEIPNILTIDIEQGYMWGYHNPYFSDPTITYIPLYENK